MGHVNVDDSGASIRLCAHTTLRHLLGVHGKEVNGEGSFSRDENKDEDKSALNDGIR